MQDGTAEDTLTLQELVDLTQYSNPSYWGTVLLSPRSSI